MPTLPTTPASTAPSTANTAGFRPSILSAYPEAVYRSFLAWPDAATNNKESVHLARMQPADDEREYYVKLYPGEQGKSRGLINEITGYLILRGLEVPQPPAAFLARIPIDELPPAPQSWIKNLQGSGKSYWGFCSEKIPGRAAALHFGKIVSAMLINDMERWNKLPVALAADEHMAHTDRHFNNVIRLAEGQYALIDNGRLVSDERNWKRNELKREKLYRHRLSEHLWNHCPPDDIASTAVLWAKTSAASFATIRRELEFWLDCLHLAKVERDAFIEFLSWRSANLEDLIKTRYHLLV